jgi:hypothetical protein
MGRYETLNPDTKDMVNAMLPAVAKAFNIDEVNDIIPKDIRMRVWDCERKDHIKDQPEEDPRNWGVQFIRELQAIARLNGGDLAAFQEMLRVKVAKHAEKHPWCRLADIKEIKAKLQNPEQLSEDERSLDEFGSPASSSVDSYLEELIEPEVPKGKKPGRKPRNAEIYETRTQPKHRKRKFGRYIVMLATLTSKQVSAVPTALAGSAPRSPSDTPRNVTLEEVAPPMTVGPPFVAVAARTNL